MSKTIAVRIEVQFSQLRMSARNSRKNRGTEAHKAKVAELAKSIAQVGLLQKGTRTYCKITDEAGIEKQSAFDAMGKTLTAELPTEAGALWEALYALPAAELETLLAYAVARSVSLAAEPGRGMTENFVNALGLDMAQHFAATAGNYFGRVSKEMIIEALDEAEKIKDDADRTGLLMLKKGALAKEAEARMVGSDWVPKLIRKEKKTEPVDSKKRKISQKAKA